MELFTLLQSFFFADICVREKEVATNQRNLIPGRPHLCMGFNFVFVSDSFVSCNTEILPSKIWSTFQNTKFSFFEIALKTAILQYCVEPKHNQVILRSKIFVLTNILILTPILRLVIIYVHVYLNNYHVPLTSTIGMPNFKIKNII